MLDITENATSKTKKHSDISENTTRATKTHPDGVFNPPCPSSDADSPGIARRLSMDDRLLQKSDGGKYALLHT